MAKLSRGISDIIGNKTRMKILGALVHGPVSVNEISSTTKTEQTNVSHSLKYLLDAKLVERRVKGKRHEYALREEIRPAVAKLLSDIRRNEELLKEGGILLLAAYIILKYPVTGEPPVLAASLLPGLLSSLKPMLMLRIR